MHKSLLRLEKRRKGKIMLVNLTNATSALPSANLIGRKAASLAKLYSTPGLSHDVPQAFALTVNFFRPWIDHRICCCSRCWTNLKMTFGNEKLNQFNFYTTQQ
jgi:hypothetical protein